MEKLALAFGRMGVLILKSLFVLGQGGSMLKVTRPLSRSTPITGHQSAAGWSDLSAHSGLSDLLINHCPFKQPVLFLLPPLFLLFPTNPLLTSGTASLNKGFLYFCS